MSALLLAGWMACAGKDSGLSLDPGEPAPDFSLSDVNPASAYAGQAVSPRDFMGQVSAWYFGHAT